ncbi:MAG TPA: efflux transporter outer membrane subunit [Verrucomicrobiae bacterium]
MKNWMPTGLAVVLGATVWSGCQVGPKYEAPKTVSPAAFGTALTSASMNLVDQEWWRSLQDEKLTQLVQQASTNNHSLKIATARLQEARALWREARFDYIPTAQANGSYAVSQSSLATNPNESRNGRHRQLYQVGVDATWELDLFGAVRSSVNAAKATVEAVEADRADVLISIRAEVAINYLLLRGGQAQLDVARRNATNQVETLRVADALLTGGRGTQLDVARAKTLLSSTLGSIPPLEASIDRTIHRLSVLTGHVPKALAEDLLKESPLPVLPGDLALGDPAALLRRRPDIRAAERSLAAATARVGVETADLFPRVSFNGRVALEATRLSGFVDSGNEAWSFGPRITWEALNLGRVRAQIKAADARVEGSLNIYEQTVLLALEETENALTNYGREQVRLGHLRDAEEAAREAAGLARKRYQDGVSDFLTVLDAERTLLSTQEQHVVSQVNAATALVSVYKSLGGGWEPEKK